ncbi:MAG: TfoX/Sxy family protein [Methylomonas sp.]|jgi:TfoX/Sxy family transcriptional regulator of competence genes
MACDENLVERIRQELNIMPEYGEKRMFGGVCFTLNGNMLCGVVKDKLMVRVGPSAYDEALKQPHARVMDFSGRPMRGYVFIAGAGLAENESLSYWLGLAVDFVGTLPVKVKPRPRAG